MNTRRSFLLLALLIWACCAARCQEPPALPESVLALQRCFPQATVRPLLEVRDNGEIVPLVALLFATISADGRRVFAIRVSEGEDGGFQFQSSFLDLTTGELSLAKMSDKQPLESDIGGGCGIRWSQHTCMR